MLPPFFVRMRLDLWLWAVRAFKTRSLATEAIRGGKVKVENQPVKPAHSVKLGQTISIRMDCGAVPWIRTLKSMQTPSSRVGAKLVGLYMEDITSPEEREKSLMRRSLEPGYRAPGSGRPTKFERRAIDEIQER
jgi:ribosome-associated heat shock protein Hsp15